MNHPVKTPLALYKYLLRQFDKLPEGPAVHYKFQTKQNFKVHADEIDAERIQQIMAQAIKDADWVLQKYQNTAPKGKS